MSSLSRDKRGVIFDYCLGLCSPSGAGEGEELIAHSDLAADLHSQVQAALAFLSSLSVEPCPDYLVDLTIRRLRGLAAQRACAEGPKSRVIRVDPRPWFRNTAAVTAVAASIVVFAGIFIASFGSMRPHHHRQVPAGRLEKPSVNTDLRDSDYAWRPTLDESQVIEFMDQVPSWSPGALWSAEYNPHQMYHFMELGPRIVPASWEYHPEQP